MSYIKWDMLITQEMKQAELKKVIEASNVIAEEAWRSGEMTFIAEQLIGIEDDDPDALPGTDREWRDYRIQVRAWKEGAEGFPEAESRPVRPS